MARFTGKNQALWTAATGSGQAAPAAFIKEFEINESFDSIDVTCFGDTNKTYLAGIPDASGSFAGYTDDATGNSLTGAVNTEARKFYHYIDFAGAPTKYHYGTAIFSYTSSYSREGAAEVSGSWNAAGVVLKSW
jgi:hypothetical protein